MSERQHLKRSISLVHLIGIEVGQSIGAGIFALTGIALALTGPSLFLAFLAAAVPVALAMAVLAMLASAEPISGGTYYYGSRLFSPVASFTGVWAYILGAVLGMFPLYALTGAAFLQAVIPGLPRLPVALLLLSVFFLTNLLGARIAMWVQAILVAVLMAALLLFVGRGLPRVSLANLRPLFPGGLSGFVVAASVLTFTILGANAAVELGDEIIEPRKNIPRSFLICIPVVTLIYLVIGLVAAGIAPWDGWSESSLATIAASFLQGPAFVFFIVGGGFLAVVTTLNSTYLWGTKSLIVITEDGLFPRALARVSRRFGTPQRFLIIIFLISCLSLVLAGERVQTFAVFASLGGIIIFIPVMGAALGLRRRHPALYARSHLQLKGVFYYLAPGAGLLLCLLVIAILLVDLGSHPSGYLFLGIFLAWVAAGALYAALRLRRLGRAAQAGPPSPRKQRHLMRPAGNDYNQIQPEEPIAVEPTSGRKISPSLMCADLLNLQKQLDLFGEQGIEYLHMDIMDGHYVPNFALGLGFCQAVSSCSAIPLDIHLMIDNPEEFIPAFARFRDCLITFHPDTVGDAPRTVRLIRSQGARAGIALAPDKSIADLRHLLPHLDLLCVMTVMPGFASQEIVPGGIERLGEVVRYVRSQGYGGEIEVDGNVSWQNLPRMRDAGAEVFVAGTSSIFEKGGDVRENIRRFRSILQQSQPGRGPGAAQSSSDPSSSRPGKDT